MGRSAVAAIGMLLFTAPLFAQQRSLALRSISIRSTQGMTAQRRERLWSAPTYLAIAGFWTRSSRVAIPIACLPGWALPNHLFRMATWRRLPRPSTFWA